MLSTPQAAPQLPVLEVSPLSYVALCSRLAFPLVDVICSLCTVSSLVQFAHPKRLCINLTYELCRVVL